MTLQALCNIIGPGDLHRTLRAWVSRNRYGNATSADFSSLAERVSGQDLSRLFRVWLYRPHRPAPTEANGFPPDPGLRQPFVVSAQDSMSSTEIRAAEGHPLVKP